MIRFVTEHFSSAGRTGTPRLACRLWMCVLCAAVLLCIHSSAQNPMMTPVPARAAKKPAAKSELPIMLPVRSGKLWGYADTTQKIVIAPQFDAAFPFMRKFAIVEKNKKAFAIDRSGKIISPGFDQLIQLEDTILSVYLNQVSDTLGGWGLCTITGRPILPMAYEEVVRVGSRVFGFRKDSLWGYVDRQGNRLTELEYDTAYVITRDYLLLQKKGKFGVIGIDGHRVLEDKYKEVYRLANDLFAARLDTSWGAVDGHAVQIVPFRFDTLTGLSSYFVVAKKDDSLSCYFSKNPGAPTPCIYKRFACIWPCWLKVYDFNGQCGLLDSLGQPIIPTAYEDILTSGCGDWFVRTKNKTWGLFSLEGKELISPRFSRIQPFRGNVTLAFEGDAQCLINSTGEMLVPLAIQQISIRASTVKVLHPDSSASFLSISNEGKIASRSDYEQLRTLKVSGRTPRAATMPSSVSTSASLPFIPPADSLNWFMDETGLWGLQNAYTGEIIFTPQFVEIQRCRGGFTLVCFADRVSGPPLDGNPTYSSGRYGLVNDSTGRYALTPQYNFISAPDLAPGSGFSGCVRVTLKDGQAGLVSTDGSERTTPFSWIDVCSGGIIRVCVDGEFTTDGNGEVISDVEKFIYDHHLNGPVSFGTAFGSKQFLKKFVRISGGKWGYVDSTGNVVISPQYEAARPSQKGTAIVKQNKKWGMVDLGNATIIPFNYDGLSYMTTSAGTYVMAQMNGLRYGYVDCNGNVVIPADLRQSMQIGYGFIAFSKTGKWGVMKPDGQVIVSETYNEIQPFSDGCAAVRRGKLWGYIDSTGTEIIAPHYEAAGKFSHGLAKISVKQRWGFIDKSGAVIIQPKYISAGEFTGVVLPVKTRDGFGFVNRDDKWVMKPSWVSITPLEGTELYVLRNDFAQGLCRKDGKVLVSPRFEAYRYIGEGRIAYRANLFWGMIDTSGRIITAANYDKIMPFSDHRAAAEQYSNWGYIDRNGRFIIQPQYRMAITFSENRAYVRDERNKGYFIDTTGKVLYRSAGEGSYSIYSSGISLLYELDEHETPHYFYVNLRGNAINRFRYKDARPFENGAARVYVENRWGLVSFSGYFLIRPRFCQLDAFDHGLARFQLRSSFGLLTLDGKELLPVQYDDIHVDAPTGMTRYEAANKVGYLFPDGRICWPESE